MCGVNSATAHLRAQRIRIYYLRMEDDASNDDDDDGRPCIHQQHSSTPPSLSEESPSVGLVRSNDQPIVTSYQEKSSFVCQT